MNTMSRQFCTFVQVVLQDQIHDAIVNVRFGFARNKRDRFDTDHDGFNITFTIDPVYLHDPSEVAKLWGKLKDWVEGWNDYTPEQAIPEGESDGE